MPPVRVAHQRAEGAWPRQYASGPRGLVPGRSGKSALRRASPHQTPKALEALQEVEMACSLTPASAVAGLDGPAALGLQLWFSVA